MHKSKSLSKRATQQIFNAFDFAKAKGTELNFFVVINLKDTVDQSAYTRVKKLFHKHNDWLAYKRRNGYTNCKPTYVYTQENPRDNIHLNWCLHIPSKFSDEFVAKLPSWVTKVQGAPDLETISCQVIDPARYKSPANYIVKGVDPEFTDYFFLRDLFEKKGPQGVVYGRRGGVSHSLGPRAIKEADFDPKSFRRDRKYRSRWMLTQAKTSLLQEVQIIQKCQYNWDSHNEEQKCAYNA